MLQIPHNVTESFEVCHAAHNISENLCRHVALYKVAAILSRSCGNYQLFANNADCKIAFQKKLLE